MIFFSCQWCCRVDWWPVARSWPGCVGSGSKWPWTYQSGLSWGNVGRTGYIQVQQISSPGPHKGGQELMGVEWWEMAWFFFCLHLCYKLGKKGVVNIKSFLTISESDEYSNLSSFIKPWCTSWGIAKGPLESNRLTYVIETLKDKLYSLKSNSNATMA